MNKLDQLNSFFDSVGLAMLAKTSREETSSALSVNTSAMGVTWVEPGFHGDIQTKAKLEKSKVEVVVSSSCLPSALLKSDLRLQVCVFARVYLITSYNNVKDIPLPCHSIPSHLNPSYT